MFEFLDKIEDKITLKEEKIVTKGTWNKTEKEEEEISEEGEVQREVQGTKNTHNSYFSMKSFVSVDF